MPATRRPAADAEARRLRDDQTRNANWKRWGTYLSERQWGTVREDYSVDGDCWNYFPHEHARSRAYRWGEDGLLGWCDRQGRLCFALALWNGQDPYLKERLFGLTGPQGNHGEDVKELYYYLDATPTHSYCRALYKYPHAAFPYDDLVQQSAARDRKAGEYELSDTGIFAQSRYFDVQIEYAKAGPDDMLVRLTCTNRGPEVRTLHVLPTFWFRNTWSWGAKSEDCTKKPRMERVGDGQVRATHETLGEMRLDFAPVNGSNGPPPLLFTDNETHNELLFQSPSPNPYVKDAFHRRVVQGQEEAVNPEAFGTKCAAWQVLELAPGEPRVVEVRFRSSKDARGKAFGASFNKTFEQRQREADAYYERLLDERLDDAQRQVARQAYAGLLWSKQFYHYSVSHWLTGDPKMPPPPAARKQGRNHDWRHLYNRDVISMPDKWEYPWYAAWDLAFHMLPLARVDPHFAKRQLLLLLREWYMHPNGQIPAYEFALGDVNPPVHAWACWRVYKLTGPRGKRDVDFLARAFQKLLINFTWWVNRKDVQGRHIFSGGFLGMDNVGVFDRNHPLPDGGALDQADGTAWMAFYCNTMLAMALELARHDPSYGDVASKFFEHFVAIADAMNTLGGQGLWDEQDGFYYDTVRSGANCQPLRVRSMVGLMPLIAAEVLDENLINELPDFRRRMLWFMQHRADLARHVAYLCRTDRPGDCQLLLAIPSEARLRRVLAYLLDENEFLAPYGIRSLSRVHEQHPFAFDIGGMTHSVQYTPGESDTDLFGGNSNWRGPVWFPVNYLLIEALERYHHFFGADFRVECPTGSGQMRTLAEVARELATRLARLFLPGAEGNRPCHGADLRYRDDPAFRDLLLFHEYFHGNDGRGLGASHQTGWTALVTECLRRSVR